MRVSTNESSNLFVCIPGNISRGTLETPKTEIYACVLDNVDFVSFVDDEIRTRRDVRFRSIPTQQIF